MQFLRQLCIPYLCMLLHTVLHGSKEFKKVTKLVKTHLYMAHHYTIRACLLHFVDLFHLVTICSIWSMQFCIITICSLHMQCLRLADVIASEKHQLYQVFRGSELKQFLTLLHSSSLELLNTVDVDPFGY